MKFISLLPSHLVPESLSFCSVLDESTAKPVPRILNGFFFKMSAKFEYYNITTYINTLPKLHTIYIVLYSEYFMASLISVSWNVISHTLARSVLT
jgi:hypothetical protein